MALHEITCLSFKALPKLMFFHDFLHCAIFVVIWERVISRVLERRGRGGGGVPCVSHSSYEKA